jgi:YebC/PmpR family DNA-binding regulatory protein
MSGHSKWSSIKRSKAVVDSKRGQVFSRLSKEITLAARDGGGDADMNPKLRTILLKARAANMPADNIDRAIKKGTGELPGVTYDQVVYEGYAPGGVAVIVEVTTDNKNRSASEVRSIFAKNGGNLAGPNAVSFMFNRCGHFLISREKGSEDELIEIALDAGAEDFKSHPEYFEIITPIDAYEGVAQALEAKQIQPDSSELAFLPENTVPVTDASIAAQFIRLVDALDDSEDVQNVHSNAEIDESLNEA